MRSSSTPLSGDTGLINPKARISSSERPTARNLTEARVLSAEEMCALIAHTITTYQPAITTACLTGLRLQELLGLRWGDVFLPSKSDESPPLIQVRHQLTRATRDKPARLVPLKTKGSRRDIRISPELTKMLREHRLASSFSSDDDFVFTTSTGAPLYYRNVSSRGLDKAAARAGLNGNGRQKLSMHDLRHSAITHLIRAGADVGQVARFADHSRPSMTLDRYTHEFEARKGNDAGTLLGQALAGVI